MIKREKSDIVVLEKDIDTLTAIAEGFIKEHNNNVDMHNYVIKGIKNNMERQAQIDAKVAETNGLIYKSTFSSLKNTRY